MQDSARRSDPALARRQHAAFRAALREAGAEVRELSFVCGAYDSVFAKDNALIWRTEAGLHACPARFRHAEREWEQATRAREMRALGAAWHPLPAGVAFEGGDVVWMPGRRLGFLGFGFRSDAAAAPELARLTGIEFVALELRDPWLYHLDIALAALPGGITLACRDAFTPEAWRRLRDHLERPPVEVPREEALRFGLNLVQVDRTVIGGSDSPWLRAALAAEGYILKPVDLSQFHLAGGSAACLTARVHELSAAGAAQPRETTSPTAAIRSASA